jgi:protein TorT
MKKCIPFCSWLIPVGVAVFRLVTWQVARPINQIAGGARKAAAGDPNQTVLQAKLTRLWIMLLSLFALWPIPLCAQTPWYPFPVEAPAAIEDSMSRKNSFNYVPLERAERKWSICVFFPHMKDAYWLAVNFGVVKEAQRLGVQMLLFEAGGYDNLHVQIDQIRESVAAGADGVVIGAISFDGLNDVVAELRNQGIPVIDVINGMSSGQVSARSLVSFEEMGYRTGKYLTNLHTTDVAPVKVAWFPGPAEAGWVKDGDKGFRRALAGSGINIVTTRYGDTGKMVQSQLLDEVLNTHPDIEYVVGTAVTAHAAVEMLRTRGLDTHIKILAYYLTPDVFRQIKRGRILAAPTDSPVIQGRIAVDQLVRILEGKPFLKQVGPRIFVIDSTNVDTFDRSTSLAPTGFRATYSVDVLLPAHGQIGGTTR